MPVPQRLVPDRWAAGYARNCWLLYGERRPGVGRHVSSICEDMEQVVMKGNR